MGAVVEVIKMSEEETEKPSKFQRILDCMERQARALEQNRDALLLLDRRMDSLSSDLKGIGDSVQAIATRQSELESASNKRRMNCAEVMRALADRVTTIEDDKTPIPKKFTPDEMEAMRLTAGGGGSNGCGGDSGLSLGAAAADDDTASDDGDDGEDRS